MRFSGRSRSLTVAAALGFGFAFLYLPIASLILYSFNASRLVTVWSGFSVRWYGELASNTALLTAAGLSLKIAAAAATIATVLGALAALALTRFGGFRGRRLFTGALAAPLVMPEVVFGLSLLILFVTLGEAIGWPAERGALTVTIAHATFAMAFVAVVVQSRLTEMDPALEEAAMDLGAGPIKTFLVVTVPIIAPALVAGWLLAFTLSLDDLVVASFVSGPGASTLPMVVYSSVRLGLSPQINALGTILVVVVALAVGVAGAILARAGKRRSRSAILRAR